MSAVEDRYLKAILQLQEAGPVHTCALANTVGVSPASATDMLARLATRGWSPIASTAAPY